jgi:sulfhydrogenase subunit gamma (sulfur reductase)
MTQTPYLPTWATIKRVRQETAMEKFFDLELPGKAPLGHKPGQFVEVSIMGVGEAPISVSSSPNKKDSFELVVRNVGNVTATLHRMKAGDKLGIRGPYGNGFNLDKFKGMDVLFVAGGIGLVPLRSLIHNVLEERLAFGRVIIMFGARTPSDLLFKDELAEWTNRRDVDFLVTVDRAPDDGWSGHIGVITTLFPKFEFDPKKTAVAICGPPVMYKYVMLELLGRGVPQQQIYLSLERRMKCGLGKCGHCQINNVYVCQKGPVFSYPELLKLEEAI